jgi:hypothetical protein
MWILALIILMVVLFYTAGSTMCQNCGSFDTEYETKSQPAWELELKWDDGTILRYDPIIVHKKVKICHCCRFGQPINLRSVVASSVTSEK